MNQPDIIAYGLTPDLINRLGPEPARIAAALADQSVTGVFIKTDATGIAQGLRQSGLAVYVSMPVFLADETLWVEHPDSRPVTATGAPAPVEEWYRPALPTHPAVRRRRLAEIEARLQQQPLDGLWLDFIRWPARWEKRAPALYDSSFDAHTLTEFADATHIDVAATDPVAAAGLLLSRERAAWLAWRSSVITQFVADAAALRDRLQPHARLGLFLLPWTGTEIDGLPVEGANVRIAGQDPVQLSRVADVLSPMVYHKLCARDAAWPAAVTRSLAGSVEEAEIWPVIERLADDLYPDTEFRAVLHAAALDTSAPVIVFNLAGMLAARDIGP